MQITLVVRMLTGEKKSQLIRRQKSLTSRVIIFRPSYRKLDIAQLATFSFQVPFSFHFTRIPFNFQLTQDQLPLETTFFKL